MIKRFVFKFYGLSLFLMLCACAVGLDASAGEYRGLTWRQTDIVPPGEMVSSSRGAAGLGWRADAVEDGAGVRVGGLGICSPGAGLTPAGTSNSWATVKWTGSYIEDGAQKTFGVYLTRLSPAVILEFSGARMQLFVKAPPKYFAANTPAGMRVETGVLVLGDERLMTDDGIEIFSAADLDAGWMLVWQGANSKARSHAGVPGRLMYTVDSPVLIVFGAAPESVAVSDQGLTIAFDPFAGESEINRIAAMPLYVGQQVRAIPDERPSGGSGGPEYPVYIPRLSDVPATESWARQIPEAVVSRCNWWAARLRETPIAVEETFAYDRAADVLKVNGKAHFLALGGDSEDGVRFTPLPPMLALAREQGFAPLSVSGDPIDSGAVTSWGPYLGFEGTDTYTYSVTGMGRYAFEVREIPGTGKEPADVRAAFDRELAKTLEAGIMAPWYPVTSSGATGWNVRTHVKESFRGTWDNPAENLYFLGQFLAAAPPDQRHRIVDLMRDWQAKYPGEETVSMPAEDDARRENYAVTLRAHTHGDAIPIRKRHFHYLHGVLPVESVYCLSEYYRLTGEEYGLDRLREIADPYIEMSDWASLGFLLWPKSIRSHVWFQQDINYGQGGVDEINRFFAGMVGMARIAAMSGNEDETARSMYHLARAAIARYALEELRCFMFDTRQTHALLPVIFPPNTPVRSFWGHGIHTFDRKTGDDCLLFPIRMSEFETALTDVYPGCHSRIRQIAYLNMTPELGRFLKDHARSRVEGFLRTIERSHAAWYIPYGECRWGREQYSMHPEDAYQLFLAHAWVADTSPDMLWKYADLPWIERGDFYYMHKLSEIIAAANGARWVAMKRHVP